MDSFTLRPTWLSVPDNAEGREVNILRTAMQVTKFDMT